MTSMQLAAERRLDRANSMKPLWDFCFVITLFSSYGFPGNMARILPEPVNILVQYGVFALQIILMLFSTGDSLMDVRIIDLKKIYNPIYLMIITWGTTSMIVTRFPGEQAIACVRFSVTALFAIWMVEKYDMMSILKLNHAASLLFLFFTLANLVLQPGRSFSYEAGEKTFCGLFTTKNPCAAQLGLSINLQLVYMKHLQRQKQSLRGHFFGISLVLHVGLLLLCKSTGAIIFALLPIAYLFVYEWMFEKRRLPLGWLHMIVSVGFIVAALTILPLFKPFFDWIGKDITLTGRTPMWEQLIHVMSTSHTFTGFGFVMFWKDSAAVKLFHDGFRRDTWGNTMTFGAHNLLIETWLDVGLLGIATYFFMLIYSMRNVRKLSDAEYDFASIFIIWQTLQGLTERSYIPFDYTTLLLFMAVALACSKEDRAKSPASLSALYQRDKTIEPKA